MLFALSGRWGGHQLGKAVQPIVPILGHTYPQQPPLPTSGIALEPADWGKLRGRPRWKWQERRQVSPAWGQRPLPFTGVPRPWSNQECQGPTLAALTQAHTGLNLRLRVHGHRAHIRGNHPQNTVGQVGAFPPHPLPLSGGTRVQCGRPKDTGHPSSAVWPLAKLLSHS